MLLIRFLLSIIYNAVLPEFCRQLLHFLKDCSALFEFLLNGKKSMEIILHLKSSHFRTGLFLFVDEIIFRLLS
jgi:hypothetical protein